MKLTEKLKGKLKNAASAEEANKILAEAKKGAEDAGVILDDGDLDKVAGGMYPFYFSLTESQRQQIEFQKFRPESWQ